VKIDVALEARAFVVLLEVKVVVVVSAASIPSAAAAAAVTTSWRRGASPHALEARAVPALSTTGRTARRGWRIVIAVQITCRGSTVHGCGGGRLTLCDRLCDMARGSWMCRKSMREELRAVASAREGLCEPIIAGQNAVQGYIVRFKVAEVVRVLAAARIKRLRHRHRSFLLPCVAPRH
jgi:hypothetical protein